MLEQSPWQRKTSFDDMAFGEVAWAVENLKNECMVCYNHRSESPPVLDISGSIHDRILQDNLL